MEEINEVVYTVTYWDGQNIDTLDVEEAKFAIREGRKVAKTTHTVYRSGPAFVRLYVTVDIKKVKEL
jgi:hypothetical protein